MPYNILVTNDDGILSPGIQALAESLRRLGKVTVVAPSQERSTTGHSLTLHKPIRLEPLKPGYYSINGTPADCAYLAIKKLFRKKTLDLVVSGINRGPNLGNDIHYSGTVAAAREATFLKIPSIAISLDYSSDKDNGMDFHVAAEIAYFIAELALKKGIPPQVLLNVNVPNIPARDIRGIKIVKSGFRYYADSIIEQKDPRGKNYYWLGGKYLGYDKIEDTDCKAVDHKYVSITPLHIDATHHLTLNKLKKWRFNTVYEKIKKTV